MKYHQLVWWSQHTLYLLTHIRKLLKQVLNKILLWGIISFNSTLSSLFVLENKFVYSKAYFRIPVNSILTICKSLILLYLSKSTSNSFTKQPSFYSENSLISMILLYDPSLKSTFIVFNISKNGFGIFSNIVSSKLS